MSEVLDVSSDWLELREAEDARARSRLLAASLPALLPAGPLTVHDLGSGTGSMMRWLAPLLPGPQTWMLHDWNARLTAHAARGARPRDRDGRPIAIRSRVGELSRLGADDLAGASLVTASALLDVLTAPEAHAIVDACVAVGAPTLLSLSVTGDVELRPWDGRDIRFARAFNAHQRRKVQGRQLLGRFGAPIVEGLFTQAGWRTRRALTMWRLDRHQPQLLGEWLDGWIDAAEEQAPELRSEPDYRRMRRAQLARGELSAVVYHLDVLGWPG
ncbi:SAM-dependent methyltransferase [Leifsonia sp. F6_8S_P_1B]|uniref:SAM-dependent methyltransferase n=1 Tax=Leifsonia williamsii TaxID=3035919 RepID=A0ABT8K8U6_9MICO|nr:SAM-dependent methyltransferase [Leifsonia williamsii]MDN4613884.1 SAM-dependent methyltransferase [Leifsonia williamsii]